MVMYFDLSRYRYEFNFVILKHACKFKNFSNFCCINKVILAIIFRPHSNFNILNNGAFFWYETSIRILTLLYLCKSYWMYLGNDTSKTCLRNIFKFYINIFVRKATLVIKQLSRSFPLNFPRTVLYQTFSEKKNAKLRELWRKSEGPTQQKFS